MIFECIFCQIQLENLDPILESNGGYTICPNCHEMLYITPPKELKND